MANIELNLEFDLRYTWRARVLIPKNKRPAFDLWGVFNYQKQNIRDVFESEDMDSIEHCLYLMGHRNEDIILHAMGVDAK